MPDAPRTPGVYVDEYRTAARAIIGVPTSVAAFVGRAWRGPVDAPVPIASHADFIRVFGGPWHEAPMADAVRQFFDNGGAQALVVRVAAGRDFTRPAATAATFTLASGHVFLAADPGSWGMNLRVVVEDDPDTRGGPAPVEAGNGRFALHVFDDPALRHDSRGFGGSGTSELHLGLSADPADAHYVGDVLARESVLLRARDDWPGTPPARGIVHADGSLSDDVRTGHDGGAIGHADVAAPDNAAAGTGLYALAHGESFNLLCIPPFAHGVDDNGIDTWTAAARLCRERHAVLIVDAPADWDVTGARSRIDDFASLDRDHAALYFPRIVAPDPQRPAQPAVYAPCGAVAGVIARTDAVRGVWQAPAGLETTLRGVTGLSIAGQVRALTDFENGELNPLGVNCLRNFAGIGHIVWGARTLDRASDWKYVPVRRTALYLTESLRRGLRWAVFEPNGEALWAELRLHAGAFLHGLFRTGAFQGRAAHDAYFVRCDRETVTQADLDADIAQLVVGFAPLTPAEFVVLRIGVRTGRDDD